jgi:hypothetical protein
MAGMIRSRTTVAANTPFCASRRVGAAMARWVMVWLVDQ